MDDPRPAFSPHERPQSRRRAPERGPQVQRAVSGMNHPPSSMPAQRRTTLVAFLVLLMAVLVLTALLVWPYVLAATMGGILALLARPVLQWLQGHHLPPRVAAALVVLGVVLVLMVPLAVVVTKAVQQGLAIGHGLAADGVSLYSLLDHVSGWAPLERLLGSPAAVEAQARGWIQSAGTRATATLVGLVAHVPNLVLQGVLAALACFFLLVDGPRFRHWMIDKIPIAADVRVQVGQVFQETAISVIWATLAAAAAQSVVMLLTYLLLGVPAAFLAAGAAFLCAWIPLLGSSPVWLVGALYLYAQGALLQALLMVVSGLLAGIIDNVVRALLLKGRSKMHPLVSLVAIFGGIEMFGILGIFLGPILAAVLIALLQLWPAIGQRYGLLPDAQGGALQPRSERSSS
jgi:predicted PurR-regulated permease PerM